MHPRKYLNLFLPLAVLSLALFVAGCPVKDPYRAAIKGSDDVSTGVHEAVVTISKLYSQGVADDAYKVAAAHYLDEITNCNMTFRKSVVTTHASGQAGAQAFLPIADSFVSCARQALPPTGPAQGALKAVDSAINGISLAISSAKGGKVGP
jgi:hypothetical protein